MPEKKIVYTVGHSTHTVETFIGMLESFGIRCLVDVRRFPGSRKFPDFDKERLAGRLQDTGIIYSHLESLGGRRKIRQDSKNDRWRNASFRAYADYMETNDFLAAAAELESVALKYPTAYMCAEAVWWRCHRALISDYLKAKGWTVMHVMATGKAREHPYTSPARVVGNRVCYFDEPA